MSNKADTWDGNGWQMINAEDINRVSLSLTRRSLSTQPHPQCVCSSLSKQTIHTVTHIKILNSNVFGGQDIFCCLWRVVEQSWEYNRGGPDERMTPFSCMFGLPNLFWPGEENNEGTLLYEIIPILCVMSFPFFVARALCVLRVIVAAVSPVWYDDDGFGGWYAASLLGW